MGINIDKVSLVKESVKISKNLDDNQSVKIDNFSDDSKEFKKALEVTPASKNAVIARLAENSKANGPDVTKLYDRMHHRHNRS